MGSESRTAHLKCHQSPLPTYFQRYLYLFMFYEPGFCIFILYIAALLTTMESSKVSRYFAARQEDWVDFYFNDNTGISGVASECEILVSRKLILMEKWVFESKTKMSIFRNSLYFFNDCHVYSKRNLPSYSRCRSMFITSWWKLPPYSSEQALILSLNSSRRECSIWYILQPIILKRLSAASIILYNCQLYCFQEHLLL